MRIKPQKSNNFPKCYLHFIYALITKQTSLLPGRWRQEYQALLSMLYMKEKNN